MVSKKRLTRAWRELVGSQAKKFPVFLEYKKATELNPRLAEGE
jgi:hypothetical protein